MPQHVQVNPTHLQKARKFVVVDGVNLFVELSSFDRPRWGIGEYNQKRNRFVIRFDYSDPELPAPRPFVHEGVEVMRGRNSGKILSISFDPGRSPLNPAGVLSLRTKVVAALDRIRSRVEDEDNLNLDVVEEILDEETFVRLTRELVAPG